MSRVTSHLFGSPGFNRHGRLLAAAGRGDRRWRGLRGGAVAAVYTGRLLPAAQAEEGTDDPPGSHGWSVDEPCCLGTLHRRPTVIGLNAFIPRQP